MLEINTLCDDHRNIIKTARADLIRLAGEMAVHSKLPSPFVEDWKTLSTASQKVQREVCNASQVASNEGCLWACRLRRIVDSLRGL